MSDVIQTLFGPQKLEVAEGKTPSATTPWLFISALQQSSNSLYADDTSSAYNPWITNIAMSYHIDCLSAAQDVNQMYMLPKQMQHDYYLHAVPKRKRPFKPWLKDDNKLRDMFEWLANANKCSIRTIEQYWQLLMEDDQRFTIKKYQEFKKNK